MSQCLCEFENCTSVHYPNMRFAYVCCRCKARLLVEGCEDILVADLLEDLSRLLYCFGCARFIEFNSIFAGVEDAIVA